MLEAWAKHCQRDFKPLRAVGPRAWIVGAGMQPDKKQNAFNGHPVLIHELQNRQGSISSPIVANCGNQVGSHANGLTSDPWAAYTGPRPSMQLNIPVRSNAGPTADKFAQQDEKIANLQKALQGLQESQTEQSHVMGQIQEEVKQRDGAIRAHVDQQMKGLKKDIENSFVLALQSQSQTFEHSLRMKSKVS